MIKSTADDIALGEAILERLPGLQGLHIRVCGTDLVMPPEIADDYLRMVSMITRHRTGDFRHHEIEARSTRSFAQWTLDVNSQLRNQPKVLLG